MKISLLLFTLTLFNFSTAHYNINWAEAPLNKIPLRYKLEHYNLKGPVKEFKEMGTLLFNKDGYVISGKEIFDFEFTYNSKHQPITYKTWFEGVSYNTGKLVLDNKGRIIESDKQYGGKFTYDKNGNWTGTLDPVTGTRLNSSFIYEYDQKNRMISRQYYNKEIIWRENFTYSKEDRYVVITTQRFYMDVLSKNIKTITYYKNGYYYGEVKNNNLKFDAFGNPINKLDEKGNAITANPISYSYYENRVTPDLLTNVTKKIDTPSAKDPNCIEGNCIDGYGLYRYNDGLYNGFFKNGKKDGFGIYTWKSGAQYVGMWQDNLKHGFANAKTFSGENIIGTYQFDQLTGLAAKVLADKTLERGHYRDEVLITKYNYYDNKVTKGCVHGDCINGYGKYLFEDGSLFTGFFKNSFMYEGVWIAANGNSYTGQFGAKNTFDGAGVYIEKSGDTYFGEYKMNKRHGRGMYYTKLTKKLKKGEWKEDVLVKEY